MEVVPEVDVPSHVLSWERAYPDIVRARCGRSQKARKFPHCVANLDPTREETYTVLGAVLAGVRSAFPRNATSLVHLGGDEVDYKAWRGDELAQWLEDHPRAFPSPPSPRRSAPTPRRGGPHGSCFRQSADASSSWCTHSGPH